MCKECSCGPHHLVEGRVIRRRFLTKTEKTEKLKGYSEELKRELVAVEERIKELNQ